MVWERSCICHKNWKQGRSVESDRVQSLGLEIDCLSLPQTGPGQVPDESCTVMKSCFLDVARGATGVMCSCVLSSYALRKGKVLDWSKTEFVPDGFDGGLVLEPKVGFYRDMAAEMKV